MKSKKAFTLIELLVVIAIIGLLMSIIMPALRKVKKQAAAIVCLANMRSMVTCWHSYTMDNDEKMVNGHIPRYASAISRFWVEPPQKKDGTYTGDNADNGTAIIPVEEELNGIRKGLLFPYIDAVDVYHCPADKSSKLFADETAAPYGSWWNSYSITGLMNGEPCKEKVKLENENAPSSDWDENGALRVTEITSPGTKIVFLENGDTRGWLMGSWIMNYEVPSWVDAFAIWHGDQSPLGFADGHAENHNWADDTTIQNATYKSFVSSPLSEREDLDYMGRRYVPGRR